MDVGVKRPCDNTEELPNNKIPQKYYVQLFPRTKESAEYEKKYMLKVLKDMLSEDTYAKSEKYLNGGDNVCMSIEDFLIILDHFLSLDNNVYDVIIKLGIFTPFHYIVYHSTLYVDDFYYMIIKKLGYDPIVLGLDYQYYLCSIASLIYGNYTYKKFYTIQPCLYNGEFTKNIKCDQILDTLHKCTYSSPEYASVVSWIRNNNSRHICYPTGFRTNTILNYDGVMMYKKYRFIIHAASDIRKGVCSSVTFLQICELLMVLLNDIEPQYITESNRDYYTRINTHNIEHGQTFTVTNVTYEIARYLRYEEGAIIIDAVDKIWKIIYDNGRYIKHANYIEELIRGIFGFLILYSINIRNILSCSDYNMHYKSLLLKSYLEVNKYEILYGKNNSKASYVSNMIHYINDELVSNPTKNFWKIYHMLDHNFYIFYVPYPENVVHLNLDKNTKNALMHLMCLIDGEAFPNNYVSFGSNRYTKRNDSEYYLYCYNIMRNKFREFEFRPTSGPNSYIEHISDQGGPEKWQEKMIMYTDIEKKGFGFLLTIVKDIRKLIVEYLFGKSFSELSYEEKYYYSSIYNGERFIYDSGISM
jgi:hypothetical protein